MNLTEAIYLGSIIEAAQRGATVKRLIPAKDDNPETIITAEARRICQADGSAAFDQDVTTLVLETTDYIAVYRWPLSELIEAYKIGNFGIR